MYFDWKIYGNQHQATREGYNLIDIQNNNRIFMNLASDIKHENYENGILFNYDYDRDYAYHNVYRFAFIYYPFKKNKQYRLSWKTQNLGEIPQSLQYYFPEFEQYLTLNNAFTPQNDTNWIAIFVRNDDFVEGCKVAITDVMLTEGSEIRPYEQYGASPSPDYPSEIETVNGSVEIKVDNGLETTDTNYQSYTKTLPIQQEMLEGDYIEDVEHHGWGKYEITGNEDWKKFGNPNNISYYLIINSILVNIDGNTFSPSSSESETKVAIVLSNHFKAISPNQLFEGSENGICLNWVGGEKQMRLGFGLDSDINTVDKLKAWLKSLYDAGTPVIVYYKLATPKSLELTEDQKSVLNSFYTYKNITNISLSDELASIDVTYKKDLETMFNNIIKQIPSSTSDTAET